MQLVTTCGDKVSAPGQEVLDGAQLDTPAWFFGASDVDGGELTGSNPAPHGFRIDSEPFGDLLHV